MNETKCDKISRKHQITVALGIIALVLLMLVSSADAAPFAYVTSPNNNSVTVIDTATNIVKTTVPVVGDPHEIAASSDGTKVYVINGVNNNNDYTISVIDTSTNTVTAIPLSTYKDTTAATVINTGVTSASASGIAVSPNGKKIYVANNLRVQGNRGTKEVGNVLVIDTDTKTTATIPIGTIAANVAVSPDGTKVYVTNNVPDQNTGGTQGAVSVIDTGTNTVTATIHLGILIKPVFETVKTLDSVVAVSPDGSKVYVTNYVLDQQTRSAQGVVSVIDTGTNTVTATIRVGNNPSGIAVSPDGKKLYVGEPEGVTVINTDTKTVIQGTVSQSLQNGIGAVMDKKKAVSGFVGPTVDLGRGLYDPKRIAISPDGSKAYVAGGSYSISVIDAATNAVTATVPLESYPSRVVMGTASHTSPGEFSHMVLASIAVLYLRKKLT